MYDPMLSVPSVLPNVKPRKGGATDKHNYIPSTNFMFWHESRSNIFKIIISRGNPHHETPIFNYNNYKRAAAAAAPTRPIVTPQMLATIEDAAPVLVPVPVLAGEALVLTAVVERVADELGVVRARALVPEAEVEETETGREGESDGEEDREEGKADIEAELEIAPPTVKFKSSDSSQEKGSYH